MNRFEGALRYLLLSASILLLSGCSYLPLTESIFADKEDAVIKSAPDQPKIAAQGGAKHEPEIAAELDVPKPKWKPDNIPQMPERITEDTEAAPTETVEQSALIENPEVQQLLGMSFLEVKAQLGQPVWIRDVYPARVWGYDIDSCSLQVFFYPKLDQAGDYRVLAYESGLEGEANGTEQVLGDVEKPLGTDVQEAEAADVDILEQKLVQACYEKLLNDSASMKAVIPTNSSP
ncbi:hypothetical protein [Kiloniella sp.]|uniref:hypothetical protein n=1 Tax=Kiloniella sp. TaxID=1938587 RepID=UPI003B0277B7